MADGPMEKVLTQFGFEFDQTKFAGIQRGVNNAANNLKTITRKTEQFQQRMGSFFQRAGQVVGAYLGLRTVKLITSDYAKGADQILKFSNALNLSTDRYQALSHAIQLGGASQRELDKGLRQISIRLKQAADGGKIQAKAFRDLGINVRDAEGKLKSADQVFIEMNTSMANHADQNELAGIASDVMGGKSEQLLNTLKLQPEAFRKAMAEAKKYGNVLSKKQLEDAAKYNDAMLRLRAILTGIRNTIASRVLPVITKQIAAFARWWRESNNAERALRALKLMAFVTGLVIGGMIANAAIKRLVMFVKWVKAGVVALRSMSAAATVTALKVAAIFAAFVILALLIEDLVAFVQGRDSVIGRLLGDTKIAEDFRQALKDVGTEVKKAWGEVVPALKQVWESLIPVMGNLWAAIKPLIGPAFRGYISFVIWALGVWAKIIPVVVAVSKRWVAVLEVIGKGLTTIGSMAKTVGQALSKHLGSAAKTVAGAWSATLGIISKFFDVVIGGAKMALKFMGLLKPTKARTFVSALKLGRQPAAATVGGAATPAIMPGLMQRAPNIFNQGRSVTANVAPGAVALTVNASGDPAQIAAMTKPLIAEGISKVFTDASRDLVKPPRGQR